MPDLDLDGQALNPGEASAFRMRLGQSPRMNGAATSECRDNPP